MSQLREEEVPGRCFQTSPVQYGSTTTASEDERHIRQTEADNNSKKQRREKEDIPDGVDITRLNLKSYRNITIGASAVDEVLEDSLHFAHPAELLEVIKSHPDIERHIEAISFCPFDSDGYEILPNAKTDMTQLQGSTDLKDKYYAMMQPFLKGSWAQGQDYNWNKTNADLWYEAISTQESGAMLALVLAFARWVTRLIFVSCEGHVFQYLDHGFTNPDLPSIKSVHVTTHDASKPTGLHLLSLVSRLGRQPSVITLTVMHAKALSQEGDLLHTSICSWNPVSSVGDIVIRDSDLAPEDVAWLAKGMNNFKTLDLEKDLKIYAATPFSDGHNEFANRFLEAAGSFMSENCMVLSIGKTEQLQDCVKIQQMQCVTGTESERVYFPDDSNAAAYEEHLRNRYRQINLSHEGWHETWDQGLRLQHPMEVIALIAKRPEVASYIEELCWQPADRIFYCLSDADKKAQGFLDDFHGSTRDRQALAEHQSFIWKQLEALALEDSDKARWRKAISDGEHSATFAVLLTLVPNLRFLRLEGGGHDYQEWLDPVFKQAQQQLPENQILPRLESVNVRHDDTEGEEGIELLDELMFIPSLRRFECCMFGTEDNAPLSYDTTLVSGLEYIEINVSAIPVKCYKGLLSVLPDLKRLDMATCSDWWRSGCDTRAEFHEKFEELCGPMLEERGMVWKVGKYAADHKGCISGEQTGEDEGMMIRCAELASELDQMDDTIPEKVGMRWVTTVTTRADGVVVTEQALTFGG